MLASGHVDPWLARYGSLGKEVAQWAAIPQRAASQAYRCTINWSSLLAAAFGERSVVDVVVEFDHFSRSVCLSECRQIVLGGPTTDRRTAYQSGRSLKRFAEEAGLTLTPWRRWPATSQANRYHDRRSSAYRCLVRENSIATLGFAPFHRWRSVQSGGCRCGARYGHRADFHAFPVAMGC